MRKWLIAWVLIAGCASTQPEASNIRNGKGWCPICRMWHDAEEMRWPIEHQGRTYRFCDPNCRATFKKDPEKYLRDRNFNPD